MRTIEQLVNQSIPGEYPDLLPLLHTTSYDVLYNKIAEKRQLEATKEYEEFNNEKLVFLFYGCARYESDSGLNSKFSVENRPITLLYEYKSIDHVAHRLMPYDSGGKDLYEAALGHKIEHTHFEINTPREDSYKKLAKILYDDNTNYLVPQLNEGILSKYSCPPLNTIQKLHDKFYDPLVKVDYDKRAFIFEAQYLDKNNIVITPKRIFVSNYYAKSEPFRNYIKRKFGSEVKLIRYKDNITDKLRDCYTKMQKRIEAYIKKTYF